MDEECISGILLNYKKLGNLTTCNSMNAHREYYLSEISQTEKDKYCMFPHKCGI